MRRGGDSHLSAHVAPRREPQLPSALVLVRFQMDVNYRSGDATNGHVLRLVPVLYSTEGALG